MKRVTAAIYDRWPHAWDCEKVLKLAGVDVKIVTKHAVQVHPDHVEKAKEALRAEAQRRALLPWPPTNSMIAQGAIEL